MVRATATIGNESTRPDVSDATSELPTEVQALLRNVAMEVVKDNPGATTEALKEVNRSRITDLFAKLKHLFGNDQRR